MLNSRCVTAILAFALAPISATAQQTQNIDAATRAELVTAREAVWRAFYQGDSAALVQLLPERMTAMGENRAQIIRSAIEMKRSGVRYQRMEFTNDQFFVNGNVAVVWSDYVVHLLDGKGKPMRRPGRAIELFVRERGRWINPHWHLDEKDI
jgi:hypothetical protein